MSLVVLVPTRGRPEKQLQEVYDTFLETKVLDDTEILFVLDPDADLLKYSVGFRSLGVTVKLENPTGNMRAALNQAANKLWEHFDIIGFIGDDHRFRSKGWDQLIGNALKDGGVAYGDDGVQGENLPTQWFVTSDIVRVFGMAPYFLNHFYIDNYWLDVSTAAGCRYYLPDVKIEHMHFSYGKSVLDETYEHSMSVGSPDVGSYNGWVNSGGVAIDADVIKQVLRFRN